MPPKRKNKAPVARRSSRSPASGKQATLPTAQKGASVAKKAKVADLLKAKPKEDDVELLSPRLRAVSSKKENHDDGKAKTEEGKVVGASPRAGKRARAANGKEKAKDDEAFPEPKRPKEGILKVKVDVVEDEGSPVSPPTPANLLTRTIVIEACTQCKSFKERADKVKRGLESAIPGISVEINPQKPRRGYFEIREEKTEVIVSLPSMNRPFTLMKQLNMDELVKHLTERCK